MTNKVFLNDQGIIEITVVGDQTQQTVAIMGEQIAAQLEQLKSQSRPRLLLDDIQQMGKVPADVRNAVVALGKTLDYDKLAMLGKGNILRLGSNLMLRAMGRGESLRFFSDRQKATAWLKSSTPPAST